jgi:beta-lactamase regulating signal transducer with metallopeptidase domain
MLTLIALALACVLTVLKRATAATRYIVMLVALLLMAAAPLTAFWWRTPASALQNLWSVPSRGGHELATSALAPPPLSLPSGERAALTPNPANTPTATLQSTATHGHTPISDLRQRLAAAMEPALPWAVALWALGVLLVSLRLTCGLFWVVRTGHTRITAVSDEILAVTERLRRAFFLSAPVRVAMSALVEAPAVLGWLRPVILLPPSALMGLTPKQLEMMIAHELAHLARYDHIVNVFQTFIETMLFYHPAMWWLSRRIREEREHCCDDRALTLCADRFEYVRALAFLETQRSGLALAGLSAAGGPLLNRIRRLLLTPDHDNRSSRWVTGILLLIALTALFGVMTVETGTTVLAQVEAPEVAAPLPSESAAPVLPPNPVYSNATFPPNAVGILCVREPGAHSFYDWRETNPASGNVLLPDDVEVALKLDSHGTPDLSFLDALPTDLLTGLLAGAFYSFRAGIEPLDTVYDTVLQTEKRERMPLHDADIPKIARLTGLRELYLDHSFVGDDGLADLAPLTALDTLSLVDTEVTDAGIRSLSALPALRSIDLSETSITDQSLTYLAAMPSLEAITLDRTAVTDAGIVKLAALPRLRRLSLNFTAVTDAGLTPFNPVTSLVQLRTWHTAVTPTVQAAAGHGTGQNQYGLTTPKVGIVLSDFNARTGPTWMQYHYSYRNPVGIAQVLIGLGYDLYAVIDPGSENEESLKLILDHLGLENRTIESTDGAGLAQLNTVVSGFDGDVLDKTLTAFDAAIKNGLGFFNTSLFGVVYPERGDTLSEILGMDNLKYRCPVEHITCRVVNSHPILGDMQPGDSFEVTMLNGFHGDLRGTPLLAPPVDKPEEAWPLYVYDLGKGRVVNMQWQKISVSNGFEDPFVIYGRCVNYAAWLPVDATW